MKSHLFVSLACLLAVTSVPGAAHAVLELKSAGGFAVTLGEEDSNTETVVHVSIPDENHVVVSVELPAIQFWRAEEGSEIYRVRVDGLGVLGVPGLPDVPALYTLIAVPGNSAVSTSYWAAEPELVAKVSLADLPDFDAQPGTAGFVQSATTGVAKPVVEVGAPFWWRGITAIPLWVRPVEYDPATNSVTVVQKVVVEIEIVGAGFLAEEQLFLDSSRLPLAESVANFAPLVQAGALKEATFEELSLQTASPLESGTEAAGHEEEGGRSTCGQYLVVVADECNDAGTMQILLDHLAAEGFTAVEVWLRSEIVTDPNIPDEDEIRDALQSCTPYPEYLLLIGDPSDSAPDYCRLPTAFVNGHHTDNYFCRLGEQGQYEPYDSKPADIHCGRLPIADLGELGRILSKTADYAQASAPQSRRATLAIADDDDGLVDDSYGNWLHFTNYGFMTDRIFKTEGIIPDEELVTAINDGTMLVDYSGHGNTCSWGSVKFQCSDVESLENGQFPFVFAHACHTGEFWKSADCMADVWLDAWDWTEAEGRGSVSYYGASTSSSGFMDSYLREKMHWTVLNSRVRELGRITNLAETTLYNYFGGQYWVWNMIETFNTFGEPALVLNSFSDDFRGFFKFEVSRTLTGREDWSDWGYVLNDEVEPVEIASGPNGGCADFTVGSGYLSQNSIPEMTDQMTVMFWMNARSGRSGYAASRSLNGGDVVWYAYVDGEGPETGLEIGLRLSDGVLRTYAIPDAVAFNEWSHVAFTIDKTTNPYHLRVHVNAELVYQDRLLHDLAPNQDKVVLGTRLDDIQRFVGYLDEVRLYSRALSSEDLAEIVGASGHWLVAHYRMTEAMLWDEEGEMAGWAYLDRSGNKHHQVPSCGYDCLGHEFRGLVDEAAYFTGEQDLHAWDSPGMAVSTELTFSTWVRFDGRTTGCLLVKGGEYSVCFNGGLLNVDVQGCDTSVFEVILPWGWHHLAIVYDQQKGGVFAFLDAKPLGMRGCTATIPDTDSALLFAPGFVGGVDEARLYSRALSREELGAQAMLGTTLGYWPFDGVHPDGGVEEQGGYHIPTGAANVMVVDGMVDKALAFNGIDSIVSAGPDDVLDLPGQSFSFSAWILPMTLGHGYVFSVEGTELTAALRLIPDQIECSVGGFSGSVPFDKALMWSHVACTYSQADCLLSIYLDGAFVDDFSNCTTIPISDHMLHIGARPEDETFHGYIDDVYLHREALPADDVSNIYEQYRGALLASWEFDEYNGEDSTEYGHDLWYEGDGTPSPFGPGQFGVAFQTNGDDRMHRQSLSDVLETAIRGVAVSFWLWGDFLWPDEPTYWDVGKWLAAFKRPDKVVVSLVQPFYPKTTSWSLSQPRLDVNLNSEGELFMPFSRFERWTHILLSYDESAGVLKTYLDGRLVETSAARYPLQTGLPQIDIGALEDGFPGRIDRVKVFGRGLSPVEVERLHAEEHFNARWTFDYGPQDVGPLGLHGELHGNANVQLDQRWRGLALELLAEGDFMVVETEPMAGGDGGAIGLTISGWVRAAAGCDGYVVSKGNTEDGPFYLHIEDVPATQDDLITYLVRTTNGMVSGSVLYDYVGQWSNVQLIYDGTQLQDNVKLYANGQELDTQDLTGDLAIGEAPIVVGSMLGETEGTFMGQLDELVLTGRPMSESEREKERAELILDLPFVSEETTSDMSSFGHVVWLLYPDIVNGALEFQAGDSVHVFPHEVFSQAEDAFTLEFDLQSECASGTVVQFGGEELLGLKFKWPCDLQAYVGHRSTTFDYDPYWDQEVHVVFRYDRARETAGLHPGELVIGQDAYTLPFSYSFSQYKDYMLYFGRHPNDEQGTAMRISNVKLYRRWVD